MGCSRKRGLPETARTGAEVLPLADEKGKIGDSRNPSGLAPISQRKIFRFITDETWNQESASQAESDGEEESPCP